MTTVCPFRGKSPACVDECAPACVLGIEPPPPDRFTTNGKEVLDRGQHFADAGSEIDAGLTAAALNAYYGANAPSENAR